MFSRKTGIVALLAGITVLGAGAATADSLFVESTGVSYSYVEAYVYAAPANTPVWQKGDAPVAEEDLVEGFRSKSNQIEVAGTEVDEMASSRNRSGDVVVTAKYTNGMTLTLSRPAGQEYYELLGIEK